MERRDFLKISALTGATAALDACGNPEHQLIRFIPEEDLVPGIATWKPSICTLCPGGCGMLVRVMQGEAEVVRKGQLGIIKMGLAKKLEGNPNHPISQGKLCPRGQAGLQVTYHPDRVRNPLKRSGPRGSGQFENIGWDQAITELASQLSPLQANKSQGQLAFVTSVLRGQRRDLIRQFSAAFSAQSPAEFAFFEDAAAHEANSRAFGSPTLPAVDLARSNYIISFGADFLGTWNSPVAQSMGYGQMRKGRPGQRGKFVHFEPRMSLTAASADEFVACAPGTEGLLALSIAQVIMSENLRPANSAGAVGNLIDGWSTGLAQYVPSSVEKQTGVRAARIAKIAREAAANSPAVAVIGDAATAHTNGLFNAVAVNALNALLGSVDQPGGIFFNAPLAANAATAANAANAKAAPQSSSNGAASWLATLLQSINSSAVKALLLYNANPVFASPSASGVRDAFAKVPFIASFGSFLDETSSMADLILPDHSPLESWLDDTPLSGSPRAVVSLAAPAMNPIHDTRAMPDVLLSVAQQLGGDLAKSLPWKTYDEALKVSYAGLLKEQGSITAKDADDFWQKMQDQGGWWSTEEAKSTPAPAKASASSVKTPVQPSPPQFDGDASEFPFHFLPFASQMHYDGSLANLPWMQEAPDPLSTVMWGSWVEINSKVAGQLGIKQGDLIEVASQHGTLRAPALVTPGIAPDAVAMPVAQGHTSFTRYASGRGANPISILAPLTVADVGSLAWAATRVKITRVGEGKLILFGGSLEERPADISHR
jgi:menaquinone reductase, molybdopterin-binding-like subunit